MKKPVLVIICAVVFVTVFSIVYSLAGKGKVTAQLANNPTGTQGSTTTQISNPTPSSTACIITISGVKYDVTSFQYMHSGGNVFNCGTDMTSIFYSRHYDSYLQYMAQYRVN